MSLDEASAVAGSNDRPHTLIIGGSGFIGSRLALLLAAQGHVLTVLDKRPASERVQAVAHCRIGDVRFYDQVLAAMDGNTLVYNLAAEHQDNVHPVCLYDQVNVEGAQIICNAAAALGVNRIVFTSSVAVYGSQRHAMDETTAHSFFNDYGRTKHLAEKVYEGWLHGDSKRCLTVVRPTVVFGPGNRGNVYNFLRQMKYGPFVMFGDGHNVKSIAHVDNVSAFLAFLADRDERCGVYNYADKPDFSMRELVAFVDGGLGRKRARRHAFPKSLGFALGHAADLMAGVIRRPLPISAVRVQKFCSSSEIDARKALEIGFRPVKSLEDGLSEMVRNHV